MPTCWPRSPAHAAIAIDHARRYENEVELGRKLAETNRELSRSLAVQQQLAEQVLLDAGPAGIAGVLAAHLGRCVVIQDHIRRVIAGASPDGGDRLAASRRARGRPEAGGDPEPISVAVRVGREVVGHLLLSAERELGPIDRALVDIAVTGVALEFAKIRATLEVEERLRGETIAGPAGGQLSERGGDAARAARLGQDLGQPHDLLVIDVDGRRRRRACGPSSDASSWHSSASIWRSARPASLTVSRADRWWSSRRGRRAASAACESSPRS